MARTKEHLDIDSATADLDSSLPVRHERAGFLWRYRGIFATGAAALAALGIYIATTVSGGGESKPTHNSAKQEQSAKDPNGQPLEALVHPKLELPTSSDPLKLAQELFNNYQAARNATNEADFERYASGFVVDVNSPAGNDLRKQWQANLPLLQQPGGTYRNFYGVDKLLSSSGFETADSGQRTIAAHTQGGDYATHISGSNLSGFTIVDQGNFTLTIVPVERDLINNGIDNNTQTVWLVSNIS